MLSDRRPLRALLLTVAGWVHREQQRTTASLVEETRMHVAGTTRTPNEGFMALVARNFTGLADGFLKSHRALIVDRDTQFSRRLQSLRGACPRRSGTAPSPRT